MVVFMALKFSMTRTCNITTLHMIQVSEHKKLYLVSKADFDVFRCHPNLDFALISVIQLKKQRALYTNRVLCFDLNKFTTRVLLWFFNKICVSVQKMSFSISTCFHYIWADIKLIVPLPVWFSENPPSCNHPVFTMTTATFSVS